MVEKAKLKKCITLLQHREFVSVGEQKNEFEKVWCVVYSIQKAKK